MCLARFDSMCPFFFVLAVWCKHSSFMLSIINISTYTKNYWWYNYPKNTSDSGMSLEKKPFGKAVALPFGSADSGLCGCAAAPLERLPGWKFPLDMPPEGHRINEIILKHRYKWQWWWITPIIRPYVSFNKTWGLGGDTLTIKIPQMFFSDLFFSQVRLTTKKQRCSRWSPRKFVGVSPFLAFFLLPSGKLTWQAGISRFSIGNASSMRVHFSASYVSLSAPRF